MFTTEQNVIELLEYLPVFAARYALSNELLLRALSVLPVVVYGEDDYVGGLPDARRILGSRDPDDIALGALALTLGVPIWSNDRDYEDFPTGAFSTARLIALLKV